MHLSNRISVIALVMAFLVPGMAVALQSGSDRDAVGEDWNLEVLMGELANRRGEAGEAQFTEIKTLASVKSPLMAKGVLRYRFPARLEKEIHKPRAERYVIDGESMEIYRDGKLKRQVLLESYPALKSFFSSFIATLGGDLGMLRSHYSLHLEGTRADWTLRLEPTDPEMQRVVKRITVQGRDSNIQSFETLQPNDDRSMMLITPLG